MQLRSLSDDKSSMALTLTIFLGVISVVIITTGTASQHCIPLKRDWREKCSLAGYNYTFPIPYKLDKIWIERFTRVFDRQIQDFSMCSPRGLAEMMLCSVMYAPSCIEGHSQPAIPCQRVCSEWIKRCANATTMFNDVWTITASALCSLLPNTTSATGKCIEPPGFEDYYNPAKSGTIK